MSLLPPTIPRALMAVAMALVVSAAPAAVALAHNGTGGASSDYRVQIIGWDGPHEGISLRVIELGNRLELHRTTATSVVVLGYSGEPYLRLDERGVYENTTSPAHYLNRDRFASTNPPSSASTTADPTWERIADGASVRWHDHRAHWMSSTPRADVLADPDVERVVLDASRIEMVVDGEPVAAIVRVTWLPKPASTMWYIAAGVLGLAVAALFVFVPGTNRLLPIVVADGALATWLGQGTSLTRQTIALACAVAAIGAFVLRRNVVALVAAAAAGVLAATRLEVFEHELLAGWMPGVGQRIAIVIGLGLCLGSVASALVGALGPTTVSES